MFRQLTRLLFPTPDAPRPPRATARPGVSRAAPVAPVAPSELPPALANWLGSLPGYDPLTRSQRRLWVPALGLATSLFILYMMFERPGAPPPELGLLPPLPAAAAPAPAARCAPGQTSGCVGGRAEVLLIAPAAPAAAAPPANPRPDTPAPRP
jgi:hypothetical protein